MPALTAVVGSSCDTQAFHFFYFGIIAGAYIHFGTCRQGKLCRKLRYTSANTRYKYFLSGFQLASGEERPVSRKAGQGERSSLFGGEVRRLGLQAVGTDEQVFGKSTIGGHAEDMVLCRLMSLGTAPVVVRVEYYLLAKPRSSHAFAYFLYCAAAIGTQRAAVSHTRIQAYPNPLVASVEGNGFHFYQNFARFEGWFLNILQYYFGLLCQD